MPGNSRSLGLGRKQTHQLMTARMRMTGRAAPSPPLSRPSLWPSLWGGLDLMLPALMPSVLRQGLLRCFLAASAPAVTGRG